MTRRIVVCLLITALLHSVLPAEALSANVNETLTCQ
jgi:hypothetical protein